MTRNRARLCIRTSKSPQYGTEGVAVGERVEGDLTARQEMSLVRRSWMGSAVRHRVRLAG